jgi:hypothetical protein
MTPVYMSPNLAQVEMIQNALLEQGIATSIIDKKSQDGMHELWLKRQADRARAKIVVTQEEFKMMRNSMRNKPVHDNRATQPVDVESLRQAMADMPQNAANKASKPGKDYFVPKNLISVFEQLGSMLGVEKKDMELDRFNKLQKPWDGDSLKKSVEDLKKITKNKLLF